MKATGKKAMHVFAPTTKPVDIGLEVAPRIKGRPKAAEPYQKVTVCLFDRHVLLLDKIALSIRERTGIHMRRAELVRAIVDRATTELEPARKDFDKTIRSLFPGLNI